MGTESASRRNWAHTRSKSRHWAYVVPMQARARAEHSGKENVQEARACRASVSTSMNRNCGVPGSNSGRLASTSICLRPARAALSALRAACTVEDSSPPGLACARDSFAAM
eukprot:3277078-Pleurochrysis_carterae.AAC.2